jgi:hypothetical protein
MTMDTRFDFRNSPLAMKFVKHINSAAASLHSAGLPAATQELVKLASIIRAPSRTGGDTVT